MLTLENVILKPLITEKSTHQSNVRNTYSFMVDDRANKPMIKQAIEKMYNVKVVEVPPGPPVQSVLVTHSLGVHQNKPLEASHRAASGRLKDRIVLIEIGGVE